MRILLIHIPNPADEPLPPLGLLAIGGPLIDRGHRVTLLDAAIGPRETARLVAETKWQAPDLVLFGHDGAAAANPKMAEVSAAIRAALPQVIQVYGGDYPTTHWFHILNYLPGIDVAIRGEGEETVCRLVDAIEQGKALETVDGIAFLRDGVAYSTRTAPVVRDLDACRIAWELIDLGCYSGSGKPRTVAARFSREHPPLCNYLGRKGGWARWRHRDPGRFAANLAWLQREQGVEVVRLVDENPAASRPVWQGFLEAMIAEDVPLRLTGSIREGQLARDADIRHLYRRAGFADREEVRG